MSLSTTMNDYRNYNQDDHDNTQYGQYDDDSLGTISSLMLFDSFGISS